PVTLAMEVKTAADSPPLPLEGEFQATIDLDAQRYRLAVVQLSGKLPLEGVAAPVPWQFAAPAVDLDLATQTLGRATFDASFGAAKVAGTVSGTKIIDAPALTGGFQLQPVNLRELLPQFGIALPATRDTKVLSALSASGNFRYADDTVTTDELKAKLDDTAMTGRFGWKLETSAMNFDLSLDRIDADRYLPPPTTAQPAAKAEPFELPVEALKPLEAKGQLAVGEAKFAGVKLASVRVGIDAHAGQTRLAPAQARLYGGLYSGDISVDARASTPRVSLQQTLTGVDVAALMNDFAQSKRLSGRGNLSMNLTAQGRNSDGLMKTLKGKVSANLTGGAVEGMDVWYAIAQAQSLLQKRALADNDNRKRTPFDSFKLSANIDDGIATSNDLDVSSQQLKVTGKGSSNLVTKAIDYQVTATVLKAPPEADANLGALTLAAIPVNITGTYDDPKLRPDLAGLARARLQKEVDKRKDEVKDKLKDRLKGLLGR
ncbi:MAG: AsmA family protein, partial [Proteobacteria bacterium]